MMTSQSPIGSGFGAASTTSDVLAGIELSGKVAVVTGGYSGLGRETVRTFLDAGARVIVPARDLARASAALSTIPAAEIWLMDLLDPKSISNFSSRFLDSGLPLHILVNNAAVMACPLTRDARGYEAQFATNHLGHFQLTQALWPALRQADGARIVSVSSRGHRFSDVNFDDPNFQRRAYDPWAGYGQSKTANILSALKWDQEGREDGIRAFSLHPGGIATTGLGKHLPKEVLCDAGVVDHEGRPIIDPARGLKTLEQGAATQVWCATHPDLNSKGGVYCEDVEVASIVHATGGQELEMANLAAMGGVRPYAVDPEAAERLWQLSRRLVKAS